MTATQRSRISFLSLIVMGTLAIPALALSAGAAVFSSPVSDAEKARVAGPLLDAPPPVVLVALGLLMVAGAVARRHRKNAAQRMLAQPRS